MVLRAGLQGFGDSKKKKAGREGRRYGPKNHLHGKQQTVLHMFLDTFPCNAAAVAAAAVQQFVGLSTPEELRQKNKT